MLTLTESVRLHVPVHSAYIAWAAFDEPAKILNSIREVRRLDDQRFHWQDEAMAEEVDWDDAVIIEDVPDEYLAWQGTSGPDNTVSAQFDALSDHDSEVTVVVNIEPRSSLQFASETAVDAVYERVRRELGTYKEYVEAQGTREQAP
jgi:uncharacterized membrane protein